MVAGKKVTPGDEAATERLMKYWAEGPGAAKIGWGRSGDYDTCLAELGKYVQDPKILHGLCANLHKRATGARPGQAPAEKAESAARKHS